MPSTVPSRRPARRLARRLARALPAAALLAAACADGAPLSAPDRTAADSLRAAPAATGLRLLATLRCTVDVRAGTTDCAPDAPAFAAPGVSADLVLDGQGPYARVRVLSQAYDATAQRTYVDVTVTNLTDQPLGTTNGITTAPQGVRVFFRTPPTSPQGAVSVVVDPAWGDGTATFSAPDQAFYRYHQVLLPNAQSWVRRWALAHGPAVTTFTFVVDVAAPAPEEGRPLVPAHAYESLAEGYDANHTCAVRAGGTTYCWGQNAEMQLGDALPWDRGIPWGAHGGFRFTSAVVGPTYSCGVRTDNAALCWGTVPGSGAALGLPSDVQWGSPTVVPMPEAFTTLAGGGRHVCALAPAGRAYCVGVNESGQLGTGNTATVGLPTRVQLPAGVALTRVAAGGAHTCGLTAAGEVYCWGDWKAQGAVGDLTPVAVAAPPGVAFTAISAGATHTCALTAAGEAYCWGQNAAGQLGDGTTTARVAPTRVTAVPGAGLRSISAGRDYTCAVDAAGAGHCWGRDELGRLGGGSPVAMPAGVQLRTIRTYRNHACGLTTAGVAYCWGDNMAAQLGIGGRGPFQVVPKLTIMP